MKTLKFKRGFAVILIFIMLISTTGCFNGSFMGSKEGKEIDVILWNTKGDRFPMASGVYLMNYARKEFEKKTGNKVNLISISAYTQEEYFEKRLEVINSDNPPEMILFNTIYTDELLTIESMKDELLHIDGIIENANDVFDGMKGDQYTAFATMVFGKKVNNEVATRLGYEPSTAYMTPEEIEALTLKWTEADGAALNLLDYEIFSKLGLTDMIQIKAGEVKLDQMAIINKLKRNETYVKSLPVRSISMDDINGIYSRENKELFDTERNDYFSNEGLRPINHSTGISFNAFDMVDFSNHISDEASGIVMDGYSNTMSVGFGILDNQSEEQEVAIKFANFLLSQDFQTDMQTITEESPRMSGSILKSVNEKEIELARTHKLLQNGNPIPEAVIEAHERLVEHFNQPGYLQSSAKSSVVNMATEEIFSLSIEQTWGVAKTDEELRAELSSLEERLNLMINK